MFKTRIWGTKSFKTRIWGTELFKTLHWGTELFKTLHYNSNINTFSVRYCLTMAFMKEPGVWEWKVLSNMISQEIELRTRMATSSSSAIVAAAVVEVKCFSQFVENSICFNEFTNVSFMLAFVGCSSRRGHSCYWFYRDVKDISFY